MASRAMKKAPERETRPRRGSAPKPRAAFLRRAASGPRLEHRRRVLLLYAPSSQPPRNYAYGLGLIAAVLTRAGHRVDFVDGYFTTPRELDQRLRAATYDVIGLSGVITTYAWQRAAARAARRAQPGAAIVSGGGLASAVPVELLELIPELDACFVGEGERSAAEFLERRDGDWSAVKGIVWRDGPHLRTNLPAEFIQDLDGLPDPDTTLLAIERYFFDPPSQDGAGHAVERRLQTQLARGCPFQCDFCANSFLRKQVRRRSDEHVLAEIGRAVEHFGVNTVLFVDDSFILRHDDTLRFVTELGRRRWDLKWGVAARVRGVSPELLAAMRSAGCRGIAFGFDSFHPETLRRMGKHTSPEDNIRAFQLCVEAGIPPISNLIIGYDNETEEHLEEDFRQLERLIAWGRSLASPEQRRLCAQGVRSFRPINFATPYPGTALYQRNRHRLPSLEEWLLLFSGRNMNELLVNISQLPDEVLVEHHRRLLDLVSRCTL